MGRRFEPDGAHMLTLAEVHKSGDYLTHEKLWIHSVKTPQVSYRSGYFLFDEGRWRGFDWTDIRNESLDGRSLIIGHCDNDVSLEIATDILRSARPSRIYATNLSVEAAGLEESTDLPLGIPNDERQSKTHIIQADHTLLRKAWRKGIRPSQFTDARLYANFSIRNNAKVRGPALEAVAKLPETVLGSFVLSKRGRLADLLAMRKCGMVMCPRGAGMDTHRFWECLLVGAIPVVLEKDHSARLAKQWKLPSIVVESWSDLKDKESVENQWNSIHDTAWDMSPLTSRYWIEKIFR